MSGDAARAELSNMFSLSDGLLLFTSRKAARAEQQLVRAMAGFSSRPEERLALS